MKQLAFVLFYLIGIFLHAEQDKRLYLGYLDSTKPIDYSKLSLTYYPYIVAYNKTADEEIAQLINDLEASRNKTGIFLGIYGGWIFANATNERNYTKAGLLAYGAKVGYQSFFPSLYDTLSIPNIVGGRIYLEYLGSNGKELGNSKFGFSGIGVSGDIVVDLPIVRNFSSGFVIGFGLLSMIYDNNINSSIGGLLNIGFSFVLADKHRLETEVKMIINDHLDWFGVMTMAGYSYVF